MHILITRPEPDALRLKGLIEARGHSATIEPLMRISFDDGDPVDLDGVTTLIATSRNAIRALQNTDVRAQAPRMTIYTVGAGTAEEARRLGFGRVIAGPGTAAGLIPLIASTLDPMDEMLLHLSGDEIAVDLQAELAAQGFRVDRVVVYRTIVATRLSEGARFQITHGLIEGALFLSPRTAAIWAKLIRKDGLETDARRLAHLCLSEAVMRRLAPLGDVPVMVADEPTMNEVLALIDSCGAQLGV
jgi:uroporphyrinogen-III synthase